MLKIKPILLAAIAASGSVSSSFAAPTALFQSDSPLMVILEMPLMQVLRQKKTDPPIEGVLRYTDAEGRDVALDMTVSVRGNNRLEQCRYPPLSVNLKRKQVTATLFAGQNKLKLVTPCGKGSTYRRYLNQEFKIYRAYNLLTEHSFRVHQLEVTFRDSNGREKDKIQPAFFIESDGNAAARLNMRTVNVATVNESQFDSRQLGIFGLFQFMIGNTDWAVLKGPGSEDCCHNGKIVAPSDSIDRWVVLPYDFDQSGIINAKYAAPTDGLPIRNVRQRLYRGFCSSNGELDSTIAKFDDNRAAIEALFGNEAEKSRASKSALKYLQDFYEIINDPKLRKKKIIAVCRRSAGARSELWRLERAKGIEPSSLAWEARVIPLYDARF
jgi:hypothetical protein